MSELARDLCPMCGGTGTHAIQAPKGRTYVRVRADIHHDDQDATSLEYDRADALVNKLAAKGYELHSFSEDPDGTTWMMRWPLRWRTVL